MYTSIKILQPTLPEVGKIKIGQLGPVRTSKAGRDFRMPVKLDHFHIVTRVRDAEGQFATDEEVHAVVGKEPTELDVVLMYDDPTLNSPQTLTCYDGSKRICRGDGESAERLSPEGLYRPHPCPCSLLMAPEQAEENKGKTPNFLLKCKPYGVLRVQLPAQQKSIGCYGFRSTSQESLSNIRAIQLAILQRTNGILAGIRLRLVMYASTDNTPTGASKNYKVRLDLPPGGWEQVQADAENVLQRRLKSRVNMVGIEASARRALKAIEDDPESVDEIMQELYPTPMRVVDGVEVLDSEPEDADPEPTKPTTPVVETPVQDNGAPDQREALLIDIHTALSSEPPPVTKAQVTKFIHDTFNLILVTDLSIEQLTELKRWIAKR